MEYEWDEEKEARNIAERGIPFEHAKQVFADPKSKRREDTRRDYGETRYVVFGRVEGRLYSVTYTLRENDVIRVISVRKANRREQRAFEEWNQE